MIKQKSTSGWFKHPLSLFFISVILLSLPLFLFVNRQDEDMRKEVAAASVDPTSGNPVPNGPTGDWHLIFSDEFAGTSLDLSKWIMCNPSFASSCVPYNEEQQLFNTALTNNKNVQVNGGQLHLIAIKDGSGDHPYSSGMVSTGPNKWNYAQPDYQSFQFTYGYYEGKVKFPKGNGLWPSLWMLPDQKTYGGWPDSGEYDVVEIAGNDPTIGHFTAHWGPDGSGTCGHPCTPQEETIADASTGFHTYGFDWEADGLTWYVDGKQMGNKITDQVEIRNTPFYIIANFSVGGTWPPLNGGPDASTPFPSQVDIEYLRVWQKGAATTTGAPSSVPTMPFVSPTYAAINDCTVNGTCPNPTDTQTDLTPIDGIDGPAEDPSLITPVLTDTPDGDGNNPPARGDRKGLISLLLQLLAALLAFFAHLFGR